MIYNQHKSTNKKFLPISLFTNKFYSLKKKNHQLVTKTFEACASNGRKTNKRQHVWRYLANVCIKIINKIYNFKSLNTTNKKVIREEARIFLLFVESPRWENREERRGEGRGRGRGRIMIFVVRWSRIWIMGPHNGWRVGGTYCLWSPRESCRPL